MQEEGGSQGQKRKSNSFSVPKECSNSISYLLDSLERGKKSVLQILVQFLWKYMLTQMLKSNLAHHAHLPVHAHAHTQAQAQHGWLSWRWHLLRTMPCFFTMPTAGPLLRQKTAAERRLRWLSEKQMKPASLGKVQNGPTWKESPGMWVTR